MQHCGPANSGGSAEIRQCKNFDWLHPRLGSAWGYRNTSRTAPALGQRRGEPRTGVPLPSMALCIPRLRVNRDCSRRVLLPGRIRLYTPTTAAMHPGS